MSSIICTPLGSHICGNGDLGIERNNGYLCGIQSTEYSRMHPYKSSQNEVKTGIAADSLTTTDLCYTSARYFGGTATVRSSRTRKFQSDEGHP